MSGPTGKDYRNPTPTCDILIELADQPGTLVFVERKNEPVGYALPGGFVDEGEWVADAAVLGPWASALGEGPASAWSPAVLTGGVVHGNWKLEGSKLTQTTVFSATLAHNGSG